MPSLPLPPRRCHPLAAAALSIGLLASWGALAREKPCEPIRPDDTFELSLEFDDDRPRAEFDVAKWKREGSDFYDLRNATYNFFLGSARKPETCLNVRWQVLPAGRHPVVPSNFHRGRLPQGTTTISKKGHSSNIPVVAINNRKKDPPRAFSLRLTDPRTGRDLTYKPVGFDPSKLRFVDRGRD